MSTGPADFVAAAAEFLTTTDPSPQDRAVAALLNHLADHWRHQDLQTREHARAVARAIREAASCAALPSPLPTTAPDQAADDEDSEDQPDRHEEDLSPRRPVGASTGGSQKLPVHRSPLGSTAQYISPCPLRGTA